MGSYDECKGYPVYTLKIIMLRVGVSGAYRTFSTSGAYRKYFNQRKVTPTKYMVQLNATMEQTHEIKLVKLYDVLDFPRTYIHWTAVFCRSRRFASGGVSCKGHELRRRMHGQGLSRETGYNSVARSQVR